MSIYHKTKVEINNELNDIEKARDNPRAFSVLYERYYRDIYVFVFRRISSESNTEDVVSQVFIKAMTNIQKYECRGLPFSSWLFRIASNEVNLFFRKSKKQRCISIDTAGVDRIQAETDQQGLDTYLLATILEKLKTKEVELLELRYFESLSIREVSEILQISESNVKVKTFRLLEKVRKLVSKEGIGTNE